MAASARVFQSDSGSARMKWSIAAMLAAIIFMIGWATFLQTDQYIKPLSLRFEGDRFLFVRDVPRGEVWGQWSQELRSPIGDCPDSGKSFYQDVGAEAVSIPISDKIKPCIPADGEVFILHITRSVMLDDWFPGRPSENVWSCVVGGPDCIKVK